MLMPSHAAEKLMLLSVWSKHHMPTGQTLQVKFYTVCVEGVSTATKVRGGGGGEGSNPGFIPGFYFKPRLNLGSAG